MSGVHVVGRGKKREGAQKLEYFEGVSRESVGAKGLCMHLVTIPPRGRTKPHLHAEHESAIYVVSGKAGMFYGEGLRQHVFVEAGDFLYIDANTPHLPYNASETEPCIGVVARTDPHEQESVVLLDLRDPGATP